MTETNPALKALFEWVNSVQDDQVVDSSQISSGLVVWNILQNNDPELFSGSLPVEPGWGFSRPADANSRNIKHVHERLTTYIFEKCKRKLPLPTGAPDLEAVAKASSDSDTCQFLKLVFMALIFGRFSMDYIEQLSLLSEGSQAQFYAILEESEELHSETGSTASVSEESEHAEENGDREAEAEPESRDPAFVYEERISQMAAANKQLDEETHELKEQVETMHDRQTQLQNKYDNLELQYNDTAERLDALRSGKGDQSLLSIQRKKLQQQETVIATFEARLGAIEQERDTLNTQNEVLAEQLGEYQQVKDEVYELGVQNEKLQRSANAAEKYRQKLQSLQKVENENEVLKHRISDMQGQLKQSDSDQFSQSDLKRENDEYRRLVSGIEQELNDSIEAKKRLEHDKTTLEAKYHLAEEQASVWQRRCEDMQRALHDNQDLHSSTSGGAPINGFNSDRSEDGSETEDAGTMPPQSHSEELSDPDKNLESTIALLKAQSRHPLHKPTEAEAQNQVKLATQLERIREDSKSLKKQVDDQEDLIASLRQQLDSSTTRSTTESQPREPVVEPPKPPDPDPDVLEALRLEKVNLEREMQLMASSWYDQSSRLMGNNLAGHLGRGRPPQEPRSFLGRQRRLVDEVTMGKI